MGVITETGVWHDVAVWFDTYIHDVWLMGIGAGLLSSVVDTFTIAISNISLYPLLENRQLVMWVDSDYMANFVQNGAYWKIIAYVTAVGGCLLSVGSIGGIALMKMEHVKLGWYIKNITPKVLVGWIVGMTALWAVM
jgi:Na+/H+ antiporter NhaD/arsenite permease-like protein